MPVSPSFLASVEDLLAPLGRISTRPMFGAAGIYADGIILAIVDDDVLHFKVDVAGRAAFAQEGCGPFTYQTKNGPHIINGYWQAPARLFDDPDEMVVWGRRAVAVSRAAGAKKKTRTARP